MDLSHEDIIDGLMEYYKRRGVDMTYVLSDPVFDKMTINEKVDAIKKHAAEILAHSSGSLTSSEKKDIALKGAWNAVSTVPLLAPLVGGGYLAVAKTMAAKPSFRAAALWTLGAAGAIGIGKGLVSYLGQAKDRKDTREQLTNYINNPVTMNAVGVLSANRASNLESPGRQALVNNVLNILSKNFYTSANPNEGVFNITHTIYNEPDPMPIAPPAPNLNY